jgi:hypothetical protein
MDYHLLSAKEVSLQVAAYSDDAGMNIAENGSGLPDCHAMFFQVDCALDSAFDKQVFFTGYFASDRKRAANYSRFAQTLNLALRRGGQGLLIFGSLPHIHNLCSSFSVFF